MRAILASQDPRRGRMRPIPASQDPKKRGGGRVGSLYTHQGREGVLTVVYMPSFPSRVGVPALPPPVHARHMHLSRHLTGWPTCRFGRKVNGARPLPSEQWECVTFRVSGEKEGLKGAITGVLRTPRGLGGNSLPKVLSRLSRHGALMAGIPWFKRVLRGFSPVSHRYSLLPGWYSHPEQGKPDPGAGVMSQTVRKWETCRITDLDKRERVFDIPTFLVQQCFL